MFSFSFALVGFIAFAWGPQAVYSHFQFISFSPVVQCGSFFIKFHGGKAPSDLPLTLTVVPLNATPISIPLPDDAWNATTATGAALTFLPFPANTQFVASLDDANGIGTALVSDVILIGPSNNTSCLPTDPAPFSNHFTIDDPTGLSQCLPFDVHFNTTVTYAAPSIRGFKPLGPSFPINMTSSDDANGTATYTMDVLRDSQVVLLFTDDTGHKESTSLLAVTGNSASSSHCIPSFAPLATLDAATKKSSAPSRVAIIVIAVVGSIVVAVALVMVVWCCRRRAKSRFAQFDKGFAEVRPVRDMEKQAGSGSQALASHEVARPSRLRATVTSDTSFYDSACYVRDPLYISSALYSPTTPNNPFDGSLATATTDRDNDSDNGLNSAPIDGALMSLPPSTPSSQFDPNEPASGTGPALTPQGSRPSRPARSQSVSTVEIEHILEMATIYSAGELVELPPPAVTASATIRSSAYLAGRESRRTSILPAVYSPDAGTPSHIRSRTRSSISMHSSRPSRATTYREPPLAPLPSSPLPSPMPATFDHLRVLPVDVGSGTRVSEFSMNGFSEETIEAFRIFPQPGQQPNQRLSDSG